MLPKGKFAGEKRSELVDDVQFDDYQEDAVRRASRNGIYLFNAATFAVFFALVALLDALLVGKVDFIGLVVASLVGLLAVTSIHVTQQWERAVVMRLGKFCGVRGPGLFFTIPLIEYSAMRIDQRVHSTAFGAEETLTLDLVPLNVDAVLFWMVFDAEKACTEVEDYSRSVLRSAQTALRDAIGRAPVAEVTSRRVQLDRELKRVLEEKVEPWGITILSVEVRDILLPKELQDVMSQEAQAEQRKKARMILMEAELGIADMMGDLKQAYADDDKALQIRQMHLLYEGMREGKGTLVVPSSWGESLGEQVAKGATGE